MSIASKYNGFDKRKQLWPHDVWPDVFQGVVKDDPEFAGALAHLIFNILETMIKRPRDIEKLCNTLKDGIEWVYPYTGAHGRVQGVSAQAGENDGDRGRPRAAYETGDRTR